MPGVCQHKADPGHLRFLGYPAPPLFVVLGHGNDAGQALDEHGPGDDKELTGLLGEATNGLLDLCILNVIGRAYTSKSPRKGNPYKDLSMVGVAGFEPATPCS